MYGRIFLRWRSVKTFTQLFRLHLRFRSSHKTVFLSIQGQIIMKFFRFSISKGQILVFCTLFTILLPTFLYSQVDEGFMNVIGLTPNDRVNVILVERSEKILVGGAFTSASGLGVGRLIRYTPEGVIDSSFQREIGFGANNWVNTAIESRDGKLLIGGQFAAFNGVNTHGLIRLERTGSIDTTFITPEFGAFMQRSVEAIALQSDGKILIGGLLRNYNGVTVGNFTRLNQNGTVDSSFHANLGLGFNGIVKSIIVQSDGKILVAGGFSSFNNANTGNIIRLNSNGTLDNTFQQNTSGFAFAMTQQRDGKIIVGGTLSSQNGMSIGNLVRMDSTGNIDTAFSSALGRGFSSIVRAISVQSDDKILVAGNFSNFNGAGAGRVVRLNPNGTPDVRFQTALAMGADDDVFALALQNNGLVLLGGLFTTFNGQGYGNFLRLSTRTSVNVRITDIFKSVIKPNPVSSYAEFSYVLVAPSPVSLELQDVMGRTMHIFIKEQLQSGHQSHVLDVSAFPTGTYTIVLRTHNGIQTQRLQIVR